MFQIYDYSILYDRTWALTLTDGHVEVLDDVHEYPGHEDDYFAGKSEESRDDQEAPRKSESDRGKSSDSCDYLVSL